MTDSSPSDVQGAGVAVEALRRKLVGVCTGRNLSQVAVDDLARLRTDGAADELAGVLAHLEAVTPARLADHRPDPATTARFATLDAASRRRRDAHEALLAATARRLGREVGQYRCTLGDAERALERLCDKRNSAVADLVDVRLVPWREGSALAAQAFRAALTASEQGRGLLWAS